MQIVRHICCGADIHKDYIVTTITTANQDSIDDYVLISSSAVYPDTESQPFIEETSVGNNTYWGKYGTDKIEAEQVLLSRVPHAWLERNCK